MRGGGVAVKEGERMKDPKGVERGEWEKVEMRRVGVRGEGRRLKEGGRREKSFRGG